MLTMNRALLHRISPERNVPFDVTQLKVTVTEIKKRVAHAHPQNSSLPANAGARILRVIASDHCRNFRGGIRRVKGENVIFLGKLKSL